MGQRRLVTPGYQICSVQPEAGTTSLDSQTEWPSLKSTAKVKSIQVEIRWTTRWQIPRITMRQAPSSRAARQTRPVWTRIPPAAHTLYSASERRITSSHPERGTSRLAHLLNKSKPSRIYLRCRGHSRKTRQWNSKRASNLQHLNRIFRLPRRSSPLRIHAIRIPAKTISKSRPLQDL